MAEQPVYVPTAGVYMAMIRLDDRDPWDVVKLGVREWAQSFDTKLETMLKAAGVELAPPADRLHSMLLWAMEDWQRKRAHYPRRFKARWDDFERLKERALQGDFGEEVEIVVRQHWSEQG